MSKVVVTQLKDDQRLVIAIGGELDASNCLEIEKEFEKALAISATSIFIDCRNLTYISSAGVGVLISLHHTCTQKGIPILFCELQPRVLNVFEILGLDNLFAIEPSLEVALASSSKQ